MITRAAALERFLTERVMGDRLFGMSSLFCVYRHDANGGCEIGQYLPEKVADRLTGAYGSIFTKYPSLAEEIFEKARSPFWIYLQVAHDNLAKYYFFHQRGAQAEADEFWKVYEGAIHILSVELERPS